MENKSNKKNRKNLTQYDDVDLMIKSAEDQIRQINHWEKIRSAELFNVFGQQMIDFFAKKNTFCDTIVQVYTFYKIFKKYPRQFRIGKKDALKFIQQHENDVKINMNEQFFTYQKVLRSHLQNQMAKFRKRRQRDQFEDQKKMADFFAEYIDFDYKGTAYQKTNEIKHYENFIEEYIQFIINYSQKPYEIKDKKDADWKKQNKSQYLAHKLRQIGKTFLDAENKLKELYPDQKKKLKRFGAFFRKIKYFSLDKENQASDRKTQIILQMIEKQKAKQQKKIILNFRQISDKPESESEIESESEYESEYESESEDESVFEKQNKPKNSENPEDKAEDEDEAEDEDKFEDEVEVQDEPKIEDENGDESGDESENESENESEKESENESEKESEIENWLNWSFNLSSSNDQKLGKIFE